MRIDGSVNNEKRHECVNYFQNSDECRIAILAITACATGLTLTKASAVVFAEMYFTPAILIQAEDRAHRIGQDHNCVNVHYLFGKDTIDERIFPELEKKFMVVSNALDARAMNLDVKNVLKGEKGEIKRKTIHSNKKEVSSDNKDLSYLSNNKGKILAYMVKKSDLKRKSEDKVISNINIKKEFDKLEKNSSEKNENSFININQIENNEDDSFDKVVEGIFNDDESFVKEIYENENNKNKDIEYDFNFEDSDINLHETSKKRTFEEVEKKPNLSNKKIDEIFNKSIKQNNFSTTDEFLDDEKRKKKKNK